MKPLYPAIGIAIVLTGLLSGCQQPAVKQAPPKPAVDSVPVFLLEKQPVNKQISFPAELIPYERAEIYAKVSGYIKSLKADLGDHVQKGQVLAILDAPEMIANYAQAKADVQAARSRYLGMLDAYRRIVNASKVPGTIATGELEKAKSAMQSDSASLEAFSSKLNAYGQLRDYLTIRSPFNGIVTQRNVDPGTLVAAGNAKPLLVVENNSTLRLRVPVPETYSAAIPDTSFIHFTVDAQPGITYTATLSRKSGALNLANRTETWEYMYQNTGGQLKSGMFASALLKLGRKAPSFLVPAPAVATNLEKRFIIRLKDGRAEWVDVRSGISLTDKTEIFGELAAGDTLLARASDEIKPGTPLQPTFPARHQ